MIEAAAFVDEMFATYRDIVSRFGGNSDAYLDMAALIRTIKFRRI